MKLLEYISSGTKQLNNEVRIEQSKHKEWKSATYCNYKKHETYKFVSRNFTHLLYQVYVKYGNQINL